MSPPHDSCPRCGATCGPGELCLRCTAADLAGNIAPRAAAPAPLPFPDIPGCEVLRLLSIGGMGELWLAQRRDDAALLVVKLPNAAALAQPGAEERFETEAEILGSLEHPNILRLLDAGTAGDGRLYMATEFVDGSDLRRLLRASRLAPARALEIFGKVCAAVEHAHAHGVVHRDLKPANILVAADGAVKVADFGLARDMASTGARTSAGDGLGTPYYLAPEALRNAASADERADVYALGVLLYEMLTGSVPMGSFTPLSQRCGLRREWDGVLSSALKDDAAVRTATVRELREAVEKLWAKEQRRSSWRIRRRMGIAAALLLAAGAGGAWLALRPPALQRPSFPAPSAATRDAPWQNSLGMAFLPVPGHPGVIMAMHETSIADYSSYVSDESGMLPEWRQGISSSDRRGRTSMPTLSPRGWKSTEGAGFLQPGFPVTPEHPAVGIFASHAQFFCAWLTIRERHEGRIAGDQSYRLPTRDEWRSAAGLTAGGPVPPVTGNFAGPEARDADWPRPRPTGDADDFPRTAPAHALPPNAHGFYHLAGNVAEWVLLPAPENSEAAEPETAPVGGSWSTLATEWTEDASTDSSRGPRRRASDIGFRCVLETGK